MAKEYQIFKNSIKNFINEQKLDIGAIYFVLKDIFRDIEDQYFATINSEIMEEDNVKDGDVDGN